MLLCHPHFRPDRRNPKSATEVDVFSALRRLGHVVQVAAVSDSLLDLEREINQFKPQLAFNLLEELRGEAVYDFHAVSYLESRGIPYTGCNPRGLIISRSKRLCAQVCHASGVLAPKSIRWQERRLDLPAPPWLAKFDREHASLGFSQKNIVYSLKDLRRLLAKMKQKSRGEVIVQEFIPGREVTVSVLGGRRLEVFPPWELHLPSDTSVASERIKFSAPWRRRMGIRARAYRGPWTKIMTAATREIFAALDLSGYVRFDFRIHADRGPFLIDVNANPNLARNEDFAHAAAKVGIGYENLIEKIVSLGRNYQPRV